MEIQKLTANKSREPLKSGTMKQIQSFNIAKLHTAEDFGFIGQVLTLAEEHLTAEVDQITVGKLKTAYEEFERAMKQNRKNSMTAVVEENDSRVDSLYVGSRLNAKSFLYHPDATKAAVARQIMDIYQKHRHPVRLAYTTQYGILHTLIKELKELGEDTLRVLAFDEWVTALNEACADFRKSRALQASEESKREAGILKRTRKEADLIYRLLVKQVNTCCAAFGESAYASFIDRLNVIVADAQTTIAARATRLANAKAAASEEGGVGVE